MVDVFFQLCVSFLLLPTSTPAVFRNSPEYLKLSEELITNPNQALLKNILRLTERNILPLLSAWSISGDLIGNAIAYLSENACLVKPINKAKSYTLNVPKLEHLQENIGKC